MIELQKIQTILSKILQLTFIILLYLNSKPILAQKTEVMTLGTFHFNFPNLDVKKVSEENQIDVLDPQYQKEIALIVDRLAGFKPTHIVIERVPFQQEKYDSLYNSYLNGEHKLTRSEAQQLGFRLAKSLGHNKVYCADEPARYYEDVKDVLKGKDSLENKAFMDFFYNNPDSSKFSDSDRLFKKEGILAELIQLNSEKELEKSLGDYLIGVFKYETEDNPFFGPDFVSGWWFNRNLKIFRNIQKIPTKPNDRILIIFGAGHMNLLNIFFEASPEYELVSVNKYLKD